MSDSGLRAQIINALRMISAHDLQLLAEAIAVQKFRPRFGQGTMIRNGRNDDMQTTKNWPDAYVSTGMDIVDGIEATRDRNNWSKHLSGDFEHATDVKYKNLSGYVFVGGYPDNTPSSEVLRKWIERFAAIGLPYERITILVGRDLVAELEGSAYAQIRAQFLGIHTSPIGFRPLFRSYATDDRLDIFQPSYEEFSNGYVGAPALLDTVLDLLDRNRACAILGIGAAGKTTLAKLVAHSARTMPSPSWFADLANPEFDEEEVIQGMTACAGDGVLFVLDNIHLGTTTASNIVRHWAQFLRSQNAKLLVLGRKLRQSESKFAGLETLELRAGPAEMEAVVSRLHRRRSIQPPNIDRSFIEDWAVEFGGSNDPKRTAVDLIAFTAAADRRFDDFQRGDFRLEANDAIVAVSAKYLEPLKHGSDRTDLLMLAALAHFEIPLYAELVSDAVGFFSRVKSLGIVLEDDASNGRRVNYKLVHPALGELLLRAAGNSFDLQAARRDIARRNPAVGAWMTSNKKQAVGKADLEDAMEESVKSGAWRSTVSDVRDIASIVRLASRQKWLDHDSMDEMLVAGNWLQRRLEDLRSVRNLVGLQVVLREAGLRRSLGAVTGSAADPRSRLHATLIVSPPSMVASFLRKGDANTVLASFSAEKWDERQAHVLPESANVAVSAARFFERHGYRHFANIALKRLAQSEDLMLWSGSDLGHLSHVLRLAELDDHERRLLIDLLFDSGWITRACNGWNLGHLCGGVMSLANHLPTSLRTRFVCDDLAKRVDKELRGDFWIDPYRGQYRFGFEGQDDEVTAPAWLPDKLLGRPVCLLGAYTGLGGYVPLRDISWPTGLVERMFEGVRTSGDEGPMGMYELQLWLGLKALADQQTGPHFIPAEEGDRFFAVLQRSIPPTVAAQHTQAKLLEWLTRCRLSEWRLLS